MAISGEKFHLLNKTEEAIIYVIYINSIIVLYIESKKKDNLGVGSLYCDGLVYTDSLDKANVLNHHFYLSTPLKICISHLPSLNEHT